MPQYDAYEDPLQLSSSSQIPLGQPGNPILASDGKAVLEPGVPVANDGIYHIQSSNNDPFHSAMSSHTHARHSSLRRDDDNAQSHLVPTTLTHPASLDPSPKQLNATERASLAAYTKTQADNDSIRLALACERCGEDLNHKNAANDPDEFAKEAHMLNGGWMHRSRASCELLSDRPVGETYEANDVEALRARPRGAL